MEVKAWNKISREWCQCPPGRQRRGETCRQECV